jgi:hypothetical protein
MLQFIRVTPEDYHAGFTGHHRDGVPCDSVFRIIGYVEICYRQAEIPELFGVPSLSIILYYSADYYGDTNTLSDQALTEVFKLYERVYWENRYDCGICPIKEIKAYGKLYYIADRKLCGLRDAGSDAPDW